MTQLATAVEALRGSGPRIASAFAFAFAGWAVNLAALEALARGVGVTVPWTVLAVAVPAALTVTVAPLAINGLGMREGVLVALLLHAGIAPAASAALAVLVDLQVLSFALGGAVMWVGVVRRQRRQTTSPATTVATTASPATTLRSHQAPGASVPSRSSIPTAYAASRV